MFLSIAVVLLIAFSCTIPTAQNSAVSDFETFLSVNKFEKVEDEYLYDGDVFFSDQEVERLYNEYKSGTSENIDSKGNIAIDRSTNARYVWSRR